MIYILTRPCRVIRERLGISKSCFTFRDEHGKDSNASIVHDCCCHDDSSFDTPIDARHLIHRLREATPSLRVRTSRLIEEDVNSRRKEFFPSFPLLLFLFFGLITWRLGKGEQEIGYGQNNGTFVWSQF